MKNYNIKINCDSNVSEEYLKTLMNFSSISGSSIKEVFVHRLKLGRVYQVNRGVDKEIGVLMMGDYSRPYLISMKFLLGEPYVHDRIQLYCDFYFDGDEIILESSNDILSFKELAINAGEYILSCRLSDRKVLYEELAVGEEFEFVNPSEDYLHGRFKVINLEHSYGIQLLGTNRVFLDDGDWEEMEVKLV